MIELTEKSKSLAKLFGGQGTINVPSWAPDSKQLAFVSYELISAEDGNKNALYLTNRMVEEVVQRFG